MAGVVSGGGGVAPGGARSPDDRCSRRASYIARRRGGRTVLFVSRRALAPPFVFFMAVIADAEALLRRQCREAVGVCGGIYPPSRAA